MVSKQQINIIKQKIFTWCTDDGIFKRHVKDNEKANFHMVVHWPESSQNFYDIIQPKEKEDLIVLVHRILLGDDLIPVIEKLDSKDRDQLYWDIRLSLSKCPNEFELNIDENILKEFEISSLIYFDGLSKDRLMKEIRESHKSKLLLIWLINSRCGITHKSKFVTSENPMYC